MSRRMQKGKFDFDDLLMQSQSVRKMGGLSSMLKMMPGMAGKISDEQMFETERRVKKCEDIVQAMTTEERTNPELITTMVSSAQCYLAVKEGLLLHIIHLDEWMGVWCV